MLKDHEITNDQMSFERKIIHIVLLADYPFYIGNIAPEGGVIKVGAVDPSIKRFTGEAIVFDSQEDAQEAIDDGTVKEGHV